MPPRSAPRSATCPSASASTTTRSLRIERVLELADLRAKRKDNCETLSKGVRQRLYVAKTLLHDPRVLLLDEPASGLDPRARIEFRELVRELGSQGKTILISSHILSELEAICNKVAVIEDGRVRYSGPTHGVASQLGALVVRVTLQDELSAKKAAELLEKAPGVRGLRVERDVVRFDLSLIGDGSGVNEHASGVNDHTSTVKEHGTATGSPPPQPSPLRAEEAPGAAPATESPPPQPSPLRAEGAPGAAPTVRELVPPLHRLLVKADLPVISFEVASPGLEQLFLRVTDGTVA
ncbi:ABC transporter ATP-binding protein [bacterium]|nr:ABC transporter ATP-binding protein [bacterium]